MNKRATIETAEIFILEDFLKEEGYPYHFNFNDEDQDGVDMNSYPFRIEIGRLAGYPIPLFIIRFSRKGDRKLLEILDMRLAYKDKPDPEEDDGRLTCELNAIHCMTRIERLFKNL